jgi:hypothetical protein
MAAGGLFGPIELNEKPGHLDCPGLSIAVVSDASA